MANKLIELVKGFSRDSLAVASKSLQVTGMQWDGVFPPGGVYQGAQMLPQNYRNNANDLWFFGNNGFSYKFTYGTNGDGMGAYETCAPLASIVNKKAKSYINGKTWINTTSGKGKGKENTGDQASKIRKLLLKPNAIQSGKAFEAQQKIYIDLSGYCICLPIFPAGFENQDPVEASSLWNIPPNMVTIKESNRLFYQNDIKSIIESVELDYKGVKTMLPLDKIFIFKDFTPSTKSLVIPESRLCSLQIQINNIIGAYESRNILLNRRGAMGILSNQGKDPLGTIQIDPTEKKELQSAFSNYGLRREQWQVIVSNAALQWQQMGYPTRDLMLFEEIQDDIMRICDAYDFPYRLLSSEKAASYNDVASFTTGLYQDAIIPEAESTYEQWNQFFKTDAMNLTILKDYAHVPALQEDKVNQGRARFYMNQAMQIEFENNLITVNQWLDANGLDPRPAPVGDMYYNDMIEAGISFGSNKTTANAVEPVEPAPVTDQTPAP